MSAMYDFLYADHEKVASLLSQLEDSGLPTETAVRAQRGKDDKTGVSAKVFGVGAELGASHGSQYEVRQTYDPLWKNSRKLIEHVGEVNKSDADLKIGQIRVLSGDLVAFDQSVLSKLMSAGSMRDFIANGMTDNSQSSKTQKQSFNEKRKEAEVLQTYISTLGLSIQFVLLAAGSGFWFNIKRDYLQLHETDVPLKFPVVISGTWNILGIIDALPRDHFSVEHLDRVGADEHVPSMIGPLATLIGTSAIMFGRRLDSHGLKPLAIYRELSIPE